MSQPSSVAVNDNKDHPTTRPGSAPRTTPPEGGDDSWETDAERTLAAPSAETGESRDRASKPMVVAPSEGDTESWDDDSERTLATDGPTFEIPSDVPSPISEPPTPQLLPAAALPRPPLQATMIGFAPPALPMTPAASSTLRTPLAKSAPSAAFTASTTPAKRGSPPVPPRLLPLPSGRAGAVLARPSLHPSPSAAAGLPPSAPSLPAKPSKDVRVWTATVSDEDDDSPTIAALSPLSRSSSSAWDSTADSDGEARTCAIPRSEVFQGNDARVVVGDDGASGDDATLAVLAGRPVGLDPVVSAELVAQLREREAGVPGERRLAAEVYGEAASDVSSEYPSGAQLPGFPPQPLGMGMDRIVPSWGEAKPQAFPQYAQALPPHPQGFPHQAPPPMGEVSGEGPQRFQAYMTSPMQQAQHAQQAQPYWMPQPVPFPQQPLPPQPGRSGLAAFPPQVLWLVAVGAVCLAIFVIGIVLFLTTKF